MRITFAVTKPSNAGPAVDLVWEGRECEVGRTGAALRLHDSKCSRMHAVIFETPGQGARIRDLDSRNGTFVNRERIHESPLSVGDEIRMGDHRLRILRLEYPTSERTKVLPKPAKLRLLRDAEAAPEPATETALPVAAEEPALAAEVVHRWPDSLWCAPPEEQDRIRLTLAGTPPPLPSDSGRGQSTSLPDAVGTERKGIPRSSR